MHSLCREVCYAFTKSTNQNLLILVFLSLLRHHVLSTLTHPAEPHDSQRFNVQKTHHQPYKHPSFSESHVRVSLVHPKTLSINSSELTMTAVPVMTKNHSQLLDRNAANSIALDLPPASSQTVFSPSSALPLVTTTVFDVNSVPFELKFEDPCAAKGFLGDIALSDAEYRKFSERYQRGERNQASSYKNRTNTSAKGYGGKTGEGPVHEHDEGKRPVEPQPPNSSSMVKEVNEKRGSFEQEKETPVSKTKTKYEGRIRAALNSVDDEMESLAPMRPRSRHRRAATARTERLWDHAVVPFVVDSNFSGAHKALFQQVGDDIAFSLITWSIMPGAISNGSVVANVLL